jgi:hypothetical protein
MLVVRMEKKHAIENTAIPHNATFFLHEKSDKGPPTDCAIAIPIMNRVITY